ARPGAPRASERRRRRGAGRPADGPHAPPRRPRPRGRTRAEPEALLDGPSSARPGAGRPAADRGGGPRPLGGGPAGRRGRRGPARIRAAGAPRRRRAEASLREKPELLYTPEQIAARIRQIGAEVARDYDGKEICVVGLIKSCMVFMADLVRAIPL